MLDFTIDIKEKKCFLYISKVYRTWTEFRRTNKKDKSTDAKTFIYRFVH